MATYRNRLKVGQTVYIDGTGQKGSEKGKIKRRATGKRDGRPGYIIQTSDGSEYYRTRREIY